MTRAIEEMVEELSQPKPGTSPLAFDSEHAQSLLNQYFIILKKNTIAYWRYPTYNAVRFTFTAIFAVLMGAAFWQAGANRLASMSPLSAMHCAGRHTFFENFHNDWVSERSACS